MESLEETQDRKVRDHLQSRGRITQSEASRLYGISRLAAVAGRLKDKGLPVQIPARLEFDPKDRRRHWAVYELETVKMP